MSRFYYTDGSTLNNGYSNSSGGWGVVEVDENNNMLWENQGCKSPTTNNEMELTAILIALQHIKENEKNNFIKPIIYSDSAYCVNLINKWMYTWETNDWKRPGDKEVKNLEIIKQIFELAEIASIEKVSGHSGVYWNEYADGLATSKIKIKS